MRSAIALLSCAAILTIVDLSIAAKERQLRGGRVVFLEIAPVDPRSLMQGDYMALAFEVANAARASIDRRAGNLDGSIVAAVDDRSIATYRRLDDGTPLAPDEVLLRYRLRDGRIKFATNASLLQEGTGKQYEG